MNEWLYSSKKWPLKYAAPIVEQFEKVIYERFAYNYVDNDKFMSLDNVNDLYAKVRNKKGRSIIQNFMKIQTCMEI